MPLGLRPPRASTWSLPFWVATLLVGWALGGAGCALPRPVEAPDRPEFVLRTGHAGGLTAMAWSPQGALLATGSEDHTVKLWAVSSRELLRTLPGHAGGVLSVAWSPDGSVLASGGGDHTVKLWKVSSGELLRTLPDGIPGSALAWSPDGRLLATGGRGHTVTLWEPFSGRKRSVLKGHAAAVVTVAWSPDGHTLATGSEDHTARLWEASSGRLLATFFAHTDTVLAVAWKPDGHTLATASQDTKIKLWDVASGQVRRTLPRTFDYTSNGVTSLLWRDADTLLLGRRVNPIEVWDDAAGVYLQHISAPSFSDHFALLFGTPIALSPQGHLLASRAGVEAFRLWEMPSGEPFPVSGKSGAWLTSIVWNAEGSALLAGDEYHRVILVWDTHQGRLRKGFFSRSPCAAWSPEGRVAVCGDAGLEFHDFTAPSRRPQQVLAEDMRFVEAVAWSPDGRVIAMSASRDIVLREAESGRLLRTLVEDAGDIRFIAWSPDGQSLAISGEKGVTLWEVASGRLLRTFEDTRLAPLAWSPEGRLLATGGPLHTVRLWDAASGALLHTLAGHTGPVTSMSWNPRGSTLATASEDHTVRLWDGGSGEWVRTFTGHAGEVRSVAWHPEGESLASGDGGGVILLWRMAGGIERVLVVSWSSDDWLAYDPNTFFFNASPEGEQLGALRFGSRTWPLYPLELYRPELRREDLSRVRGLAAPVVEPKPLP